ncbi:FecR family protein [Parahaliea mediterranea]|uniref:FecR domain-containing protein n=1 Tax=Parahaliea mediterranea TaxID=651086 RepID=A0A939DFS5_9GAMM|nr:FecR domain-containing protein [Parahaliea mediterranea]MBN7797305.1 FecR domain-containing protein [Parahaliea mediterranea]
MIADHADTRAQARDWLLRMSSGEAGEADYAALRAWLEASPEHARAFESVCRLWGELDLAREAVLRTERAATGEPAPPPEQRLPVQRWRWALAASVVLALLFAGAAQLFTDPTTTAPGEPAYYSTDRGEIRSIELADGSTVTLGAHSRVTVRYAPAQRRLALLRGEAFFDVASDPRRPFTVSAGGVSARALGTAFNVSLGEDAVRVAVAHGRVAIQREDPHSALELAAGQASGYRDDGSALALTSLAGTGAAPWREGRRDYFREPLRQLVADLNRYSDTPIYIASSQLGKQSITASFDHFGDVDAVLRDVEDALPARVVHTASGIHIRVR